MFSIKASSSRSFSLLSAHVVPWSSAFPLLNHVVISYRQHNPQNTGQSWDDFGLLPRPTPCRTALPCPHTPTELRGFSQACISNRAQAFGRICKNSLCSTCTKPKCNALLKQDSKIKTTAKHYWQPKTHSAIWTEARRKYCSSTSLLSFKNQDLCGNDALFPLFK